MVNLALYKVNVSRKCKNVDIQQNTNISNYENDDNHKKINQQLYSRIM